MEEKELEINPLVISISAVMLTVGIVADYFGITLMQNYWVKFVWYVIAFLPVGFPVMKIAVEEIFHGDFTSEHNLMTIATIGAFAMGEFPEAGAVMLLYSIGEYFQDRAVDKARDNIKSVVAFRPDNAFRVEGDNIIEKLQEEINVGDIIEVRSGERVPLDGSQITSDAAFNTAALTGESLPRVIERGSDVMAGMISSDSTVRLCVSRPSSESAVSRILKMVESATERKAPTELFISKFAHIYTPMVVILAILVVVFPFIISILPFTSYILPNGYVFSDWLNRALIFLVVSCPCALVISIPLGYFAGIGAASRRGILFKGSNYIDVIANTDVVVFDKTGTLTTGEFTVQDTDGLTPEEINAVVEIERTSNHPIAKALVKSCGNQDNMQSRDGVKDIPGYGLKAGEWLVGTLRLLEKYGVSYPEKLKSNVDTIVVVARENKYVGVITLADTLKVDSKEAITSIQVYTEILSGDKQSTVSKITKELGVSKGYGDLLPQDKVEHIARLKENGKNVAFVGDGINDAPVLAMSDVGIAMGAMGSDMAIETADIVIETDQPSKVSAAMCIARRTRKMVMQNIIFAIGIKLLVMILGLFDIATLWEAVFADSGVALLAVLNSMRIFI